MDLDCIEKIEELSEIFKALSHPIRLMIIKTLMSKKCNVTDLEKIAKISQSGVSQHLRLLRLSNIIEPVRVGKEICYKINNPLVIHLVEFAVNFNPDSQ